MDGLGVPGACPSLAPNKPSPVLAPSCPGDPNEVLLPPDPPPKTALWNNGLAPFEGENGDPLSLLLESELGVPDNESGELL